MVDCVIALRAYLDAGVGGVVDVRLDWKRMLAVLPTESAVIIRIACIACTGSNTGPGVILAKGVYLDGTSTDAESCSRVSPESIITHLYAGLVDLAAEASIGAGVGTYVQNHIGVDVLNFGTLCHALSSGVIGE